MRVQLGGHSKGEMIVTSVPVSTSPVMTTCCILSSKRHGNCGRSLPITSVQIIRKSVQCGRRIAFAITSPSGIKHGGSVHMASTVISWQNVTDKTGNHEKPFSARPAAPQNNQLTGLICGPKLTYRYCVSGEVC